MQVRACLYQRGLSGYPGSPPPAGRVRSTRLLDEVVDAIWGTLHESGTESLTLPRREFVQQLSSVMHARHEFSVHGGHHQQA